MMNIKLIAVVIPLSIYHTGYKYKIEFANYIISYQVRNPGDKRLHYNIKKWLKGPI